VILRGGVAVCLLLSAHRAVIFAIAQLSWLTKALHDIVLNTCYRRLMRNSLGKFKTLFTALIPFYLIVINLTIFSSEKGIYLSLFRVL